MVPPSSILNSIFDLTTLSFISAFLLFSLFALAYIFYFRLKTQKSYHLREFSSLWAVRALLVSFIALWALTETLRLPSLFLHRYPFPFFPALTLTQQANLCKIHVVFSLGLFEPGFLATLLFLVNVSLRKRADTFATAFSIIFGCCLPIFVFHVLFVFFLTSTTQTRLPEAFIRSFVLVPDGAGASGNTVHCLYPLLSSISFGAFGIVYALTFLLSSWQLISLVINKGLRFRIYALALAVLLALPIQILFLGISVLWYPDDPVVQGLALVVFLCVLSCAVVGVGILVIRPVGDALAVASGESCRWTRCNDRPSGADDVAVKPV